MHSTRPVLRLDLAGKWLVAVVAVVAALASRSLNGQVYSGAMPTMALDSDDEAAATPAQGFAVLKADSKIVEMIEDFDRYAAKKSWELAFRTLNSIDEAKSRGMVPAEDGFLVPIRARVKQSLLRLPPEGREAYRLFNDANAKQLWEQINNPKPGAAINELPVLRKLVDRYFMTSVGDLAADRLGDALFEQGNFAAAEGLWRQIVEKYPDGHLSAAKLQVKRCVALSRLGRRDALAALADQVRDQYADQKVTIGGQEVAAADFVRALVPRETTSRPAPAPDAETVLLPATDEPLWQIRLMGANPMGQINPQTGLPMVVPIHAAPCGAVDDKRFYANWLGTIYAADLQTGKIVWRTGKFSDGAQQAMNYLQQGISAETFFLTADHGRLYVMRQPTKNLLGQILGNSEPEQDGQLALECLDPKTGQTAWSARNLGFTVVSVPYFLDGACYVVGILQNNSSMYLAALDQMTGRLLWKMQLGTPQNNNNNNGGNDFGGPKIAAANGMLYVATNNGELLAVNQATHRIEWALKHDTKPININNQRMWVNGSWLMPLEGRGSLLDDNGLFYLKDASSRLLYAVDPTGPSVKWKRPVSADETVAAIDGSIAYLLGSELSALDLRSRKLLWSTKLPGESAMLRPLLCADHIYMPTARGIFDIDPSNGDIRRVFRGADRESNGGRLLVAGDKLISITDMAVTAYPIPAAKAAKIISQATHE